MGECATKQNQIQAETSAIHYISAVVGTGLIELIGTPRENKMKCQAMLEEQRRQVEKAYQYQVGECAIKQIKEAESSAIHYSPAVLEATLIEQIGALPVNKMKCTFQMGECAKQIKAVSSAIASHYSPPVAEAATQIEQIGTFPVNKMKCQETPSETLFTLNSMTAEQRERRGGQT